MKENLSQPGKDKGLSGFMLGIIIAVLFICWGLIIFFLVGDKGPPAWDFGSGGGYSRSVTVFNKPVLEQSFLLHNEVRSGKIVRCLGTHLTRKSIYYAPSRGMGPQHENRHYEGRAPSRSMFIPDHGLVGATGPSPLHRI